MDGAQGPFLGCGTAGDGLADLGIVDSEGRGGVSTVSRNSYRSQRDKYTARRVRMRDRWENIRESRVAREGEVEWQGVGSELRRRGCGPHYSLPSFLYCHGHFPL